MKKQRKSLMAVRDIKNYSLSYEILNQSKTKTILFLHGWGSNKEIMKQAFAKKLKGYKHIYLDMPGFGSSSIDKAIGTKEYALIVIEFLNSLHVEVDVVVGHSFGGKVATLLEPKNLVLLSSAGIVVEKSFKIKIKIKIFKFFKNIVPQSLYKFFISDDVKGMSQTMYEVFKRVVDEDFASIFEKSTCNTLIFWGKEDSATPQSSGETILKLMKNSKFFTLEGDHFFFMKNSKYICEVIENEQL